MTLFRSFSGALWLMAVLIGTTSSQAKTVTLVSSDNRTDVFLKSW